MANVGRPKKFETVEDMAYLIDRYFNSITKTELMFDNIVVGYEDEAKERPIYKKIPILDNNNEQVSTTYYYEQPTIIGLCRYLDINRSTLIEYEKIEEFSNTIKRAKENIEEYLERQLYRKDQVTGIIFNLKNNFNWTDKTESIVNQTNINTDITNLTAEEQKTRIAELKRKFAELKETEK
jgi:hypothetical protein